MILKPVIVNNKKEYEEISFEEALQFNHKTELVFSNEYEEEEFFDYLDSLDDDEDIDDDDDDEKTKIDNDKIESILPFLDEEDIHEIIDSIINNKGEYKNLKLENILPFLDKDDADKLFLNTFLNNKDIDITEVAPFVSQKCLDQFTDEYLKGNYKDVDIESLYPFLSSNSIKKIFKHYLSTK